MERPLQAYMGDEPYVFVCYSHDDKALVYPEIRWLQDRGVHVWYDEGISPGEEWSEELGRAIERAERFLYFVTPNSVASRNCRNELHFAHGHEKPIISVHLEATKLPVGLELVIGSSQAILKSDGVWESYRTKLTTVLQIDVHGTSDQAKSGREMPGRGAAATLRYQSRWVGGAVVSALALVGFVGWLIWGDARAPRPFFQEAPTPVSSLEPDGFWDVSIDSFEALSGAPETRQLMRSLAGGVGRELSRSSAIRVVVGASGQAAGNRAPVDYVLKGAIGLSAGHANASIQLISATDGQLVWAESFEASASAASSQVPIWTKQIARMVGAMIPLHQESRFLSTNNELAVSHFLEALAQFVRQAQGAAENWGLIVRSYERAARQDPDFFEAYTGLANAYANRLGDTISADEALPKARAAIDKALQLAPGNERALLIRGQIEQGLELDYASARQSYDLAQEGGTPPATIDWHMAVNHLFQGQFEEAITRLDAARRASVGFDQVVTLWQLAVALELVGDHHAALENYREAIASASERVLWLSRSAWIWPD